MAGHLDYSIPAEELESQGNVFPTIVHGRNVWVKKRRKRENLLFWRMQKMLYRITGLLLLLPPDLPAVDNVVFETGRLRQAAALGLRIPAILHQTDDYFVLEDAGMHLEHYVRQHPAETAGIIDKATAELRRMHELGLAHGGAQIKNITVRDGEIFFIDLEESIPPGSLELFKLRDLFLFLFSLEKTGHNPQLRHIAEIYGGDRADLVLEWIVKAIRQLRTLRIFNSRFFAGWSLRDIRAISNLVGKADVEYKRKQ